MSLEIHASTRGGRVDSVGEYFTPFRTWTRSSFDFKKVPGAVMSLRTFVVPDATRMINMDDARDPT